MQKNIEQHLKKLKEYYKNKQKTKPIQHILESDPRNKTSRKNIPADKLNKIIHQTYLVQNLTDIVIPHVPKIMQDHIKVACFIEGILTIHLDNNTWASQFRYLKVDLLSQLRKYPEFAALSEIKHQVCSFHKPIKKKPTKSKIDIGDMTVYHIRSMMKTCNDPKLESSLRELLKNLII